jgi:hypothetical protein
MRRNDQPSRPNAMTCSRFSLLKTWLMTTEGNFPLRQLCLKPFLYGRFSLDHLWPLLGDHRGKGFVQENDTAWNDRINNRAHPAQFFIELSALHGGVLFAFEVGEDASTPNRMLRNVAAPSGSLDESNPSERISCPFC